MHLFVLIKVDQLRFAAADGLYWLSRRIHDMSEIVNPGRNPHITMPDGQTAFDMGIIENNRQRAVRAGRK